jgi:hypothetical protein
MGTASPKKFIKNVAGVLTEEATLLTSAGAGDNNKIPALNASGVLDATIVNSTITSAGAGSSGQLTALDASGRLDTTVMPVGIGAPTLVVVTSEALAAGAFVNLWTSTGTKARNADATTSGKKAVGFVLAAYASGASATVYFAGANTAVSGQTVGDAYLQTTAGQAGPTAPAGSGNLVQNIGVAVSATSIEFTMGTPVVLA